eukprot:CAMPEP_0170453760 /NCGR_PEP_ID=MMETSP0123-20130129/2243_1 /TAXON_ID=182087 /ORGANISM="Favella ehrenbergii, Strain Fehren 1" /LENGTH=64 /DNA_ID=CAMNT_0010716257 /DNA_START=26 /DNA_END=220 /DNA_ORIENTATION=-
MKANLALLALVAGFAQLSSALCPALKDLLENAPPHEKFFEDMEYSAEIEETLKLLNFTEVWGEL